MHAQNFYQKAIRLAMNCSQPPTADSNKSQQSTTNQPKPSHQPSIDHTGGSASTTRFPKQRKQRLRFRKEMQTKEEAEQTAAYATTEEQMLSSLAEQSHSLARHGHHWHQRYVSSPGAGWKLRGITWDYYGLLGWPFKLDVHNVVVASFQGRSTLEED